MRNALDPERQPLTYEFRLAADEAMSQVVAAESGVAEGLGFTSWTVTTILDEDAVYYWSARARTAGDAPEDFSPWSVPVAFRVDTVNALADRPAPAAADRGQEVATRTPALVVENATDPEGDPLTYRFRDRHAARPRLARRGRPRPELPPGAGETAWTPPLELLENTLYYWRAHASDGNTRDAVGPGQLLRERRPTRPRARRCRSTPWTGRTVGTATPTLRLRNAVDPEGDPLTYEIEVRDARRRGRGDRGRDPLRRRRRRAWTVDARPGREPGVHVVGPRQRRRALRPLERPRRLPGRRRRRAADRARPVAARGRRRSSRSGARLSWSRTRRARTASPSPTRSSSRRWPPDGSTTPVERAEGVAETPSTTAWTPSLDLADGSYQWRARASDPRQNGPWSATWRFEVLVDPPPAAPIGLRALAGDARVRLDWNASPECPTSRATASTVPRPPGGPHAFVAAVAAPGFDDLGLTNGVTYYYVVTATDARAESGPSNEAAARPEAPQALVAEVRYDPAVIRAECLLPGLQGHRATSERPLWGERRGGTAADRADASCRRPSECPDWLFATLELPAGHDPAAIEVPSLRLFGSVAADPGYQSIVDTDRDGLPELRVRFAFDAVAPHLSVGVLAATIVGRAGGVELRGTGRLEVAPALAQPAHHTSHAPATLLRGGRSGADHVRPRASPRRRSRSAPSG